jgi:predicted DNA-binding antitoxin AbrB/MazE fold protein
MIRLVALVIMYNDSESQGVTGERAVTIQFDAVYQNGVLLPKEPLALPEGIQVRVAIEAPADVADPLAGVIGIADGPAAGDASDRHDDYLYGPMQ